MKKRASLLAVLLAASLSFTSVVPALAVEVPAGEVEAVEERAETGMEAEAKSELKAETDSAEESESSESESTSDSELAVKPSEEAGDEAEAGITEEAEHEAEVGIEEDSEAEVETESAEEAAEDAVNVVGQPAEDDEAVSDETESGYTDPKETEGPIVGEPTMETYVPGDTDGQSSDDLFAAYVDKAFGGANTAKKLRGGGFAGARLTGVNKAIYNYLAAQIPSIANGERASTSFAIDVEEIGIKKNWTAQDLGVNAIFVDGAIPQEVRDAFENATVQYNIPAVNKALLSDYPYQMYWYDKTVGVIYSTGFGWSAGFDDELGEDVMTITSPLMISFAVSTDFDVEGEEYTVDTNVGQSVQDSVNNANAIVSKYSSNDDRAKLRGYRDDICDLVSYNDAAVGGGASYGNPWQMIWVFDGDPETKVVCEGYSKAFKYLCDQTDFQSDIRCLTVSGTMGGGTGAGAHMWNVVRMDDGRNYVVDVTNCDTGTVGWPDQLFLATATYTSNNSYDCACDSGTITYSYNSETIGIYNEFELLISSQSLCNHSWGTTYVVDRPAACTEEGSEAIHCTICGAIKPGSERAIEATGHSYGDWEVTEQPSCATEGSRKKICPVCGDEIEETISALGHSMEKTEAEAATCTSDGHVEYWTCNRCGKLYLDSEGADEVNIDETIIHATGHAYGDWTVTKEASCTEAGSKKKVCAACGDEVTEEIPATGHAWSEWTVIREATEDEEGLERRTCSNDPSHTEERMIPKLTHVHELIETEAKEASCTEDGNVEFWTCSKCGKVYSDGEGLNEIDPEETVLHASGHSYSDWTITKEATCTETGSKEKTCANCGDKITEEIPAIGHAWSEWTVIREATEEEEGLERRTCSNDPSHTEERMIPKLTHVHELIRTEVKEASCTEDGNVEFWTCSDCGRVYSDSEGVNEIDLEETVIHATGHAYGDWTVTKEVTCTETGSREKVCANCGDKIIEEIPAAGHAWSDWIITKEATCTEAGSREKVCTNCGEKVTEEIPAPGHQWNESYTVDKDPTYTEEGEESIHCSVCGEIQEGSKRAVAKLRKLANTISAKSFSKVYSTKAQVFALGVKVKNGTPTYKSNSKYVVVSKAGKVTVKAKFIGKATITITAPASTNYTATTKKITVTVVPTKTALVSVTSPSAGKMTVKWKKNAVGTGYQIQYSTSSKFTSPKYATITKNTTLSKTIGSLVKGKKYYVRIRTYKTVGSAKFYSGWSAVKAVTIRK